MQYDVAMSMFGGVGDTSNKSAEFDKIKKSFIKDGQTDKNAMYKNINTTVFPVVGPIKNLEITTKAFYDKNDEELIKLGLAGKAHGQGLGGLGVDIGTNQMNYPVVTTQYETVLADTSSYMMTDAGGLSLTTYSDNFQQRYLHLQNNTVAQAMLQGLIYTTQRNNLYRFTLPPGYQIGNVGNTGKYTTGVHLHYELIPYRR
jgi:hypothetical protein